MDLNDTTQKIDGPTVHLSLTYYIDKRSKTLKNFISKSCKINVYCVRYSATTTELKWFELKYLLICVVPCWTLWCRKHFRISLIMFWIQTTILRFIEAVSWFPYFSDPFLIIFLWFFLFPHIFTWCFHGSDDNFEIRNYL